MPDAADIGTLLQDGEVVKTLALQRHRCRDTGDARADDDDSRLSFRHR